MMVVDDYTSATYGRPMTSTNALLVAICDDDDPRPSDVKYFPPEPWPEPDEPKQQQHRTRRAAARIKEAGLGVRNFHRAAA